MPKREPSRLEMQVLTLLWERGPSTVRDVLEGLPDGKARAYTTVLTVMQVMEKKGLLTHTTDGNAHVYRPRVSRKQTLGPVLRNLLQNIFGGSPASALQHLLAESEVSREEMERIKEVIAEHEGSAGSTSNKGSRKDS